MISKFVTCVFLGFLLSVRAASYGQVPKEQCQDASTVFRTVTVTAQPSQQTVNKGVDSGPVDKVRNRDKKSSSSPSVAPTAAPGVTKDTKKDLKNKDPKPSTTQSPVDKKGKDGKPTKTSSSVVATTTSVAKDTGKDGKNKDPGAEKNNDPQKSLTLDPRVVAKGFATNGQDPPVAGQVASLTSTNNFINFCLTVPNLPITNGKQVKTGSCNPAPIGMIPSVDNMPSSKFVFPKNFGTIKAGQTFTVEMAIKNMETGFFVNAQANYFAAPQQLNGKGQIKGHSHVVIEKLDKLDQTKPTDPRTFAFFKGLNAAAQNGKLTATVDKGLEPGVYKLSSINTASNHQPCIAPIAQHGSLDDAIYFTVTADGKPQKGNNPANPVETSTSTPQPTKKKEKADPRDKPTSTSSSVTTTTSTSASASPTKVKRVKRSMMNNRL